MEERSVQISSKQNPKLKLSIIPGHFATSHSHINYYIDITSITHQHTGAKMAAKEMAIPYRYNMEIDTIVCMDGCEVVGAYLASELADTGIGMTDSDKAINVITPEFNVNGQLIFRDNLQSMVWGKSVLLVVASVTTGKTVKRALECIEYYGGRTMGISAIFSAVKESQGVRIEPVFTASDLPNYRAYTVQECPYCKEHQRVDAIVNSYGYSRL